MKIKKIFYKIFNNWSAKLFSFAAAVLLYFSYQILSLDSKSFSVPLEVYNEGNLTTTDKPPASVRLVIHGKGEQVSQIKESDIKAFINAGNVKLIGRASLPVELTLSNALQLIDPLDIEVKPHIISLNFEQTSFLWLPVKPLFVGTVPDGYAIDSWECVPPYIKVVGPESILQTAVTVYADAIHINEQQSSFTASGKVQTGNEKIQALFGGSIEVRVKIIPEIVSRTFDNLSIEAVGLQEGLVLSAPLQTASLSLSGAKLDLNNFAANPVVIQADFTAATGPGKYTVPLRVNIPDSFTILSISASSVSAELLSKIKHDAVQKPLGEGGN